MANEVISIALQLVDNFSNGLALATKQVDSLAGRTGNLASAFAPLSMVAGAALGSSVKLAVDYEKAMNGAARALDLNAKQLEDFGKEVTQIQRNLGYQFSKQAIANIAADAGKLGIAAKDVGQFAETIGKLGVATDQTKNMEKLSMDSANVMNIFKMTIPQFKSYAGALNMLDDKFATTSLKLTEFVKIAGGTVKNLSNISSNNLLAYGAAFTDVGVKAGAAGTTMNKIISVLGGIKGATEKQESAMEALGWTTDQFSSMYQKDANGALLQLLGRLKALSPEMRTIQSLKLFGLEHLDNVSSLVGQYDKLKVAQALANNETANAFKLNSEFAKQQKTVAGQMEAFKNIINTIGVSLGKSLLPGILSVMNIITPFILQLEELTNKHPEISALIAGALGIVAIIAPLAAITSAIAGMMPIIAGIAGAIATVIGLVVSAPVLAGAAIAAIGAAVGALAYVIYSNWDKIKKTIVNTWDSAIASAKRFFSWIDAGVKSNMSAIANWGNSIVNSFGNAISQASQPVVKFINWVEQSFNSLVDRAVKWGQSLLQGFISGFQSMYSNVQSMMTNWTNWLRQFLPSSDAKRGGLSDLTYSGQMFAKTFMEGIEAGGFYNAMSGLSTPRVGGLQPAYASTPASSAPVTVTYTINGVANSDDLIKKLKTRDKELLDLIKQSTAKNTRSMY